MNLRSKMMIMVISFIFVILFIFVVVINKRASGMLYDSITDTLNATAVGATNAMETKIESQLIQIEQIARRPAMKAQDTSIIEKVESLKEDAKASEKEGVLRYGIANLQGRTQMTNNATSDVSARDYFKASIQGNTFITTPMMAKSDQSWIYICSTPLYYDNSELYGVLFVVSDGHFTSDYLAGLVNSEDEHLFMVDSNGNNIGDINFEHVVNNLNFLKLAEEDDKYKSTAEAVTTAISNESGIIEFVNSEKKKALLSYVSFNNLDWTLLTEIPRSVVNAQTNLLFKYELIIFLVSIVFAIFITYITVDLLTKPIKKSVERLAESVDSIEVAANALNEASQEIASGAQEQASGLEETSASIEELSSMVHQNLDNSKQTTRLSQNTSKDSTEGYKKITEMLDAMNAITKSTQEIDSVITIIDDISFQTNMLALNAAVEAARAGEAGLGFAVVADEVKNLANRSSESAKDTSIMIQETVKNVTHGNDLSKDLGLIFSTINENIKNLVDSNLQVEMASKQQDQGINQITTAVQQLDTVVQRNADLATETASSAESLKSEVYNMQDVVGVIKKIIL